MLAGFERGDGLLSMVGIRCGEIHDIHRRVIEQPPEVSVRLRHTVPARERLCLASVTTLHGGDTCPGCCCGGYRDTRGDVPEPNEPEADARGALFEGPLTGLRAHVGGPVDSRTMT